MSLNVGDIVMIILEGHPEHGMVGSITKQCHCFCSFIAEVQHGQRVFQVSCSAGYCFNERALRRIGDGKRETDVPETEGVAA